MRSIKFRAWDKKYRNMITDISSLTCYNKGGAVTGIIDGNSYDDLEIPQHVILMQFTGLIDKNGDEIYEGDLVIVHQHPLKDKTAVVEWETYGWVFHTMNDEFVIPQPAFVKVIGNIYENKELLKEAI